MSEMSFGGEMAMVFILAQMFCLRNGVRTKREKKGTRGRVFELFCASNLAGRLNLVRRTEKVHASEYVSHVVSDSRYTMTRTQSNEHEHVFLFCSQQFAQLLQNTDYPIVFGAFIPSPSSYLLQRDIRLSSESSLPYSSILTPRNRTEIGKR